MLEISPERQPKLNRQTISSEKKRTRVLFFVIIIVTYFVGKNTNEGIAEVKDVYNNVESIENCTMEQIVESSDRYKINIFYPVTNYEKLNTYASQAVDPQIKQMFTKSAQDALNTKTKLM